MKSQARAKARELAQEFLQRGDATGWFEVLYANAQGDEQNIQWADMICNPNLLAWLDHNKVQGKGQRALAVGCGLGDDAEELARRGFEVVAFDIAPTAVTWCQQRFPDSPVEYVAADVLHAPQAWQHSFDFVYEGYTLQVLPPDVRKRAMQNVANFVAPAGTLLVICRGRSPEEGTGNMPWFLARQELDVFLAAGLQEIQFEDYLDQEEPPTRRFLIRYQRS